MKMRGVTGKARWRIAAAAAAATCLALTALTVVPAAKAASPSAPASAIGSSSTVSTKATKVTKVTKAESSAPCVIGPDTASCASFDPTLSVEWTNFGDTTGCVFSYTLDWGDGSTQSGEQDGGPAGSYVFATHTYKSPGTYTISSTGSVVSGSCFFRSGSAQFTYGAHYELDLKLWIPQQGVVDPANPTGILPYFAWRGLARLGVEPDLSNPDPAIGPFEPGSTCQDPATFLSEAATTVSSVLDGDGYTGYDDGTTYRAAAKVSFDWDGSTVSNILFTPYIGMSHRLIIEKTRTGSKHVTLRCVEYHPGTATVSATPQGQSGVFVNMTGIVGFLTSQAAETGAYPSSTWKIQVNPDASLGISYAATDFPTTGLQVLINGQVQGTSIVNDASCYTAAETLGPFAVANFLRLFHTMTKGSLPAITPDGPPSDVDLPSPGCLF